MGNILHIWRAGEKFLRFDVANRKKIQPYQSERKIRAYQAPENSAIPKWGGDTNAGLMTSAEQSLNSGKREFYGKQNNFRGEICSPNKLHAMAHGLLVA